MKNYIGNVLKLKNTYFFKIFFKCYFYNTNKINVFWKTLRLFKFIKLKIVFLCMYVWEKKLTQLKKKKCSIWINLIKMYSSSKKTSNFLCTHEPEVVFVGEIVSSVTTQ